MIISSLNHITQAYHAGGVGMSKIITHICEVNGISGMPTDVYSLSGRKVCPATMEKFSAKPILMNEIVLREEQADPEDDDMNFGDDEEEPPVQQPQQHMPPPQMPRAG